VLLGPIGRSVKHVRSRMRFGNRKGCIVEAGIARRTKGEQVNGAGADDVIVIGASAGGIAALKELMADLPADLPAPILVVLHVSATSPSALPSILDRVTQLDVRHAADGDLLERGVVLVAPPDQQLTVAGEAVRVERGPRENGLRPAVDPLMRSAARHLGRRAVGVVLTGMLSDGTVGLAAIKAAGGVTIVQDPGSAAFSSMPQHAIDGVGPDYVVPLAELGALLRRVVGAERQRPGEVVTTPHQHELPPVEVGDDNPGQLTAFTCPECHGTLWEVDAAGVPQFRCRVGHRYAIDSLVVAQSNGTETALWAAARALEEKASLSRRVAVRLSDSGHAASALKFERIADEAEVQAAQVKLLIEGLEQPQLPVPASA
jgi:two-component system, chemotaxis family, protein-glutamate methylesterase/glutaminase